MWKQQTNYVWYPTVSQISQSDIQQYLQNSVSTEELLLRIELLENKIVPQLQSEISRLKNMESEVIRLREIEQKVIRIEELLKNKSTQHPALSKPQKEEAIQQGSIIPFGHYQGHAIEWQVLEVVEGKALLISRYGLAAKKFNELDGDTSWENCTLRRWLNEDFYQSTFSVTEQKKIRQTRIKNQKYTIWRTKTSGNSTNDGLFLLDSEEAEKYYADRTERTCVVVEYMNDQLPMISNSGFYSWWLRTPGHNGKQIACVTPSGAIYQEGLRAAYDYCLVRPAMWITLGE